MRNLTFTILFLLLSLCFTYMKAENKSDKEYLPQWQEGYLDIHQIATGRGNAAFLILPDGTTMIIDIGDLGDRASEAIVPALPNDSLMPAEWIVKYIRNFYSHMGKENKIDYIMLTHHHNDHIGGPWSGSTTAEGRGYDYTGVAQLVEYLKPDKIVDRDYPDYNYPTRDFVKKSDNVYLEHYLNFVEYQSKVEGIKFEKQEVGSNTQFPLLYNPEAYPEFEIRTIYSSGRIWTGEGTESEWLFPEISTMSESNYPNENIESSAIHLSYGNFDFFTAGDITGTQGGWKDVETPVARLVGAVEVTVANHHAYSDAQTSNLVSIFRPKAFIIPAWDEYHPQAVAMQNMVNDELYPEERYIFTTGLVEACINRIGDMAGYIEPYGHIVTRVYPGGDEYQIFTLDAHTTDYPVIASTDIFTSRIGNLYIKGDFGSEGRNTYMMHRSNDKEFVSERIKLDPGNYSFIFASHRTNEKDFWGNARGMEGRAEAGTKDIQDITFTVEEKSFYYFKFNTETFEYVIDISDESTYPEMYYAGDFQGWDPSKGGMYLYDKFKWRSKKSVVLSKDSVYEMKFLNDTEWKDNNWGGVNGLSGIAQNTTGTGGGGNLKFKIEEEGHYIFYFNDDTYEYSVVRSPAPFYSEMYFTGDFLDWVPSAGPMELYDDFKWRSKKPVALTAQDSEYQMKFLNDTIWQDQNWGGVTGLSGIAKNTTGSGGSNNLKFKIDVDGNYMFYFDHNTLEYAIVKEESTPTGTEDNMYDTKVKVYPNITPDLIHIKGADTFNKAVYDINGKQLLLTNRNTLDISAYDNGIYFVKVAGQTYKVIKQ